jgi:hypothetical protein
MKEEFLETIKFEPGDIKFEEGSIKMELNKKEDILKHVKFKPDDEVITNKNASWTSKAIKGIVVSLTTEEYRSHYKRDWIQVSFPRSDIDFVHEVFWVDPRTIDLLKSCINLLEEEQIILNQNN